MAAANWSEAEVLGLIELWGKDSTNWSEAEVLGLIELWGKDSTNWSEAEVLRLIELWGEDSIQQQLEGEKRNKHVYEKLARELHNAGSDKTAEQCRAKVEKLKGDYRK